METYCGIGKPVVVKDMVSVIIPTMNSAHYISFALQGIHTQTYKNKELIVVDNYSKDNTEEVARRYGARVFIKGNERGNQLNYGALKARGEYLYFTGSDMIANNTYIEEAVVKIKEGYDAIYASVLSKKQKEFWGRVKAFERELYINSDRMECSRFIKKSVFFDLGLFDDTLISLEEDFQHRLDIKGYKTGRINAREVHLHEALTLKEIAQKSYYYGMYIKKYLKKYPAKGSGKLFPIRWDFIRNVYKFVLQPDLGVGLIAYKFVQYWYGLMGLLSSKNKDVVHKEIYEKHSLNNTPKKP